MEGRKEQNARTFIQGLKALAETSIVLTAALFLVGWSYLYGYYRAFGLSATELGFPIQSVFMFSLPVIQTRWFIAAFLLLIVILFLGNWSRVIGDVISDPVSILFAVAVIGVLTSNYAVGVGRNNAHRDAFDATTTLPYVKLDGVANATGPSGCSTEEWNYRLLLRGEKQTYVILPLSGVESASSANLRVCGFYDDQIRTLRIQVGLGDGN